MALVLLCSAKGAPGLTTSVLALTMAWPRPAVVMVEADTAGPGVYPGYLAGRVPQNGGVLGLATAAAFGELPAQFWANCVHLPPVVQDKPTRQRAAPQRFLLPGVASPAEAPALAGVWGPLASFLAVLESSGCDVLVDVGRLTATADARDPLLALADLVCVVTRSGLADVTTTVRLVQERVPAAERTTTPWRVLLVGEDRPYSAPDIARQAGLAHVGTIAWDPAAAQVLSAGTSPGRFATSPMMRTAQTVANNILKAVGARRAQIGLGERTFAR